MKKALTLITIAVLVFALPISLAYAGKKTFDLGKEITATSVVCLDKETPIAIHEALAAGEMETASAVIGAAVKSGTCGIATISVTFTAQIHRVVMKTGEVLSVYEGTSGGTKVYVPTQDFEHNKVEA
jgi:hypothetical protein